MKRALKLINVGLQATRVDLPKNDQKVWRLANGSIKIIVSDGTNFVFKHFVHHKSRRL